MKISITPISAQTSQKPPFFIKLSNSINESLIYIFVHRIIASRKSKFMIKYEGVLDYVSLLDTQMVIIICLQVFCY